MLVSDSVLRVSNLKEFINFMKVTEFDTIISAAGVGFRAKDGIISRHSIYGNDFFLYQGTYLDGVSRNVIPNLVGMIGSIITFLTTGQAVYFGSVDAATRNLTLYDIIARPEFNFNTGQLNYYLLMRQLDAELMTLEQKRRLLIVMRLLANKDGNLKQLDDIVKQIAKLDSAVIIWDPNDERTYHRATDDLRLVISNGLSKEPHQNFRLQNSYLDAMHNRHLENFDGGLGLIKTFPTNQYHSSNYLSTLQRYGQPPPVIYNN
uniref:VP9 n=1 Tax=viral metagenome TaxID=1070528 RepID=A0A2V0R9V4_9ZZZZ